MTRFVAGYFALFMAVFLTTTLRGLGPGVALPRDSWLWLSLCAAPTLSASATAEFLQHLRRRALFHRDAGRTLAPIIYGLVAAAVTVVIAALAFVWLSPRTGDVLILVTSAALSAAIVLFCCRKRRPGRCVRCDYDVSHSLDFGRCPECGTGISNL